MLAVDIVTQPSVLLTMQGRLS